MSPSFGAGKASAGRMESIVERAWEDYRLLSKASAQLKPICDQILSLIGSLHLIDDHLQTGDLSIGNRKALRDVESFCHNSLSDLEALLTTARTAKGADRFSVLASKTLDPSDKISKFVERLRSDRHKDILDVLSQFSENQSAESLEPIVTEWSAVETELEKLGLPQEVIEEEFFFISDALKENFMEQVEEEDDLPDYGLPNYDPGEIPGPIEEKVRDLDETTRNMSIADPVASSSKVEPPPYTFEEGPDGEMLDSDFSELIENAKAIEAKARLQQKKQDPNNSPHPTWWLPKSVQAEYRSSQYIIPIMPADSFSAMTYETAPRCSEEIERLRRLLQASSEYKTDMLNNEVIRDGFHSLEVMSRVLSKFALIQNQKLAADNFSDLDILDFEYTTAGYIHEKTPFPKREFEQARKSYYQLLTYVMGFLQAMSVIFPGRTIISSSLDRIKSTWKESKMGERVAWVEKQLAAWEAVENATHTCRDWHRGQPILQKKALESLEGWKRTEKILSGTDKISLEVNIKSASMQSKSTFRTPNFWVRVAYPGPGGLRTDVVKGTEFPVWDKSFLLLVPLQSKTIDFQLVDNHGVSGTNVVVAKLTLPFSIVPGVEANFADRSLLYDFDEDIDFPLTRIDKKGKETTQPFLKLGLKWTGRITKVESLGLSPSPPGKMFRTDIKLPLSSEEEKPQQTTSSSPLLQTPVEQSSTGGSSGPRALSPAAHATYRAGGSSAAASMAASTAASTSSSSGGFSGAGGGF